MTSPDGSSRVPDGSKVAVPESVDPGVAGPESVGPGVAGPGRHPWRRYVALGDSFTEGIGDPDPTVPGGNRGWADRVADELGRDVDHFSYANLAIRGRLYREIIDEQLQPAIDLHPDLVSISAGGNDVLRLADPDQIAEDVDDAVAQLAATGATVLLFTAADVGSTPVLRLIRGREAIYNENMRVVAARHGALVVDLWALRTLTHASMWAEDRLHFSPLGHQSIAIDVLDTLGVPHDLHTVHPDAPPERTWRAARQEDLQWARTHLGPWVMRRVHGRSSGDDLAPKRPEASPVFGHPMPTGSAPLEHD